VPFDYSMNQKLTPGTALLLIVPPLLWAGNAIVGRLVHDMVPPIMLNFLRWAIALVILLPLGYPILARGSGLGKFWKKLSLLGLLGIGLYNAFQYLALQTSTPINVTLVAASMPVWMLLIGRMFFSAPVSRKQVGGAALSMAGVVLVMSRGDWTQLLALRLVPGDLFMILATISWSFYSWLLTRSGELGALKAHWAHFLLAQVLYGAALSGAFAAGEMLVTGRGISWNWGLVAALAYVAIGPAIIAFRCWGTGVQRVGPNVAGFFSNLTPLFAAVMSSAFLGELPHVYHGIAFLLIVGGIVLSSRK
jgi:drug/metabolite transporter (DMT)-like permease